MLLSFNDNELALAVRESLGEDVADEDVQVSTNVRGFAGGLESELIILGSAVAPLVLKKLADIIVALIKAKSERSITVNGVSVKGYSRDETLALLERFGGTQAEPAAESKADDP